MNDLKTVGAEIQEVLGQKWVLKHLIDEPVLDDYHVEIMTVTGVPLILCNHVKFTKGLSGGFKNVPVTYNEMENEV